MLKDRLWFPLFICLGLLLAPRAAWAQKKHALEEKGLKSLQSDVATSMTFDNKSKQTIKIFWLDFEGKRKLFVTLKDGDTHKLNTYFGHWWLVTDAKDNAWSVFAPDSEPRTVIIVAPERQPREAKTIEREVRRVEGWSVYVDKVLLTSEEEVGTQALRVLGYKLYEIKQLVPADRLARLQQAAIALDLDCPRLTSMQYHPSATWLKENGHDPALVRKVHIPRARALISKLPINQQPMVILHELAHAYHDQVLGFDEPRIKQAWARFKDSGKYEKVMHLSGKPRRHYALTNQMEFFAEMTEAFFGTNDFYPFVRSELRQELPEVYTLLEEIWGTASAAG